MAVDGKGVRVNSSSLRDKRLCKEEVLVELVSVQRSVQEVPGSISRCDLRPFCRLLSFPCSLK